MVRNRLGILVLLMVSVPSAICATVLEGRIEAIVKPNATLPAPVLKMQVAKMDTTVLDGSANTLSTGIGSQNYPDYGTGGIWFSLKLEL